MTNGSSPQTVFIVEMAPYGAGYSGDEGMFGHTGIDHNIRVEGDLSPPEIYNPGNTNDFTYNGGSMYINGVLQSGNATAGTAQLLEAYAGPSNGFPWGSTSLSNPFDGRYFNGEIGEVLAYTRLAERGPAPGG